MQSYSSIESSVSTVSVPIGGIVEFSLMTVTLLWFALTAWNRGPGLHLCQWLSWTMMGCSPKNGSRLSLDPRPCGYLVQTELNHQPATRHLDLQTLIMPHIPMSFPQGYTRPCGAPQDSE